MTPYSVLLALHGSIILLSGLVGGLFFARAIKQSSGEVAWRVVHAGGCAAGVMLLGISVPVQWISLPDMMALVLVWSFLLGTYLLVVGMFVAAIWSVRGVPGGGVRLNRLVNGLYAAGTVLSFIACILLVVGLARTYANASVA
ncbi:MAG: hypothetical protein U0236_10005 [Nitrospira sp.]